MIAYEAYEHKTLVELVRRLEAERDALRARVEKLEKALKDFSAQRKLTDDTYNGGHHDPETNAAFHHGMMTVFNVYDAYAKAALSEDGGKGFMGTDLDFKDF